MRRYLYSFFTLTFFVFSLGCNQDSGKPVSSDKIQVVYARVGTIPLSVQEAVAVEPGKDLILSFSTAIDEATTSALQIIDVEKDEHLSIAIEVQEGGKLLVIQAIDPWERGMSLELQIGDTLKGVQGESFSGLSYYFKIKEEALEILHILIDGEELKEGVSNKGIPLQPVIEVNFNLDVPLDVLENEIFLTGSKNYDLQALSLGQNTFELRPAGPLKDLEQLILLFTEGLGEAVDRDFVPKNYFLETQLDSTPDFDLISDEELLTLIQSQTFRYFWDLGHPLSGLALERNSSTNIVTSGGSGFGLMAMIVAVERGFISRDEALDRWEKILDFLEKADRFHGAWAHWMEGNTGKVRPFSQFDNGGDLVETAFLVQGLITLRQYLDPGNEREMNMIEQINFLWEGVEWDWYTQGGQKVLYWHWSPEFNWQMNLPIRGHNETQIVYILAAASPNHSIEKEVYSQGYARNGSIVNGNTYYGIELPVGYGKGGPLFFSHYSYLGLDPRDLSDSYANYWDQNVAHSLINRAYCIDNPKNYSGYSADCWGLTASDNYEGYSAHSPDNDKGVITPTAAISSLPYTPEESMQAIRFFYYVLGDRLWGDYGFYDAFSLSESWTASSYLAIDQGPIICMIENHRTALLWDLFMSAPEIQEGLQKLGFSY